MLTDAIYRFQLLLATSPEIERRPLLLRPRTMAAVWGGLLICKLFAIVAVDAAWGVAAFLTILGGGALATQLRFRHESAPPRPQLVPVPIPIRD